VIIIAALVSLVQKAVRSFVREVVSSPEWRARQIKRRQQEVLRELTATHDEAREQMKLASRQAVRRVEQAVKNSTKEDSQRTTGRS